MGFTPLITDPLVTMDPALFNEKSPCKDLMTGMQKSRRERSLLYNTAPSQD